MYLSWHQSIEQYRNCMKNIFLLKLLLLTISFNLQSQNDRKLKISKSNGFYKEYYVKKDNKKVKDGSYVKYRHALLGIAHYGIALSETGYYKNNVQDSIWQYYYNKYPLNSIKATGYYINGVKEGDWISYYIGTKEKDYSLSCNKKNIWKIDSLSMSVNYNPENIRSNGIYFKGTKVGLWRYYFNGNVYLEFNHTANMPIYDLRNLYIQNDTSKFTKPHFVGGTEFLVNYLNKAFFPEPHKHKTGNVIIEFTISKYGSVRDFNIVENSSNKAFGKQVLYEIENLPHDWIPSFLHGIAKETTYKIKVSLETCEEQGVNTLTYRSKTYKMDYEFLE